MKANSWPAVAVIVLNWNGKQNTSECLRSLMRLEYPNCKIIIVDNASTDGSQEFLRNNFPQVTLIENEVNLGFGGGLNRGIKEAQKYCANYILCLNNDVIVDKNILNELVKVGESSLRIAGLSPMEFCYDEPNRINCAGGVNRFGRSKIFGHGELDNGKFNKVMETALLSGPAMLFRLDALMDIGYFDESFFYGPEDRDIALRLRKRGYKLVFVPFAKLWHKRRGATGGAIMPLNVFFNVRNYLLFAKKHANRFELLFCYMYFGLFELPQILLRTIASHDLQYIRAAKTGILSNINRAIVPSDAELVDFFNEK